jgi:AcrR family transcriptional regulator
LCHSAYGGARRCVEGLEFTSDVGPCLLDPEPQWGLSRSSLYYIFRGEDELVAAYLRGRHDAWRQRVEARLGGIDDPDDKILVIFDAIADYVSLPEFPGCPFDNADAEAPAGECQGLATKECRDWVERFFLELAADTGATDSKALADALIVLYNRALTTATTTEPARRGDDRQTHRAAHLGGREGPQLGLTQAPRHPATPGDRGLPNRIAAGQWQGQVRDAGVVRKPGPASGVTFRAVISSPQ